MRKVSEVGLTRYLPFVVKKKTVKEFQAQFAVDAEHITVHARGTEDWVPLQSLYPSTESVMYTVNIKQTPPRIVYFTRNSINGQLKVDIHYVTFNNNLTSMSNLSGNVGFLVFSTVAKLLNEFVREFSKDFQCYNFVPAHDKLVKVYEVLAKESEKQGFLVYLNKDTGKTQKNWYLLNKLLWNRYKQIKNISEEYDETS